MPFKSGTAQGVGPPRLEGQRCRVAEETPHYASWLGPTGFDPWVQHVDCEIVPIMPRTDLQF